VPRGYRHLNLSFAGGEISPEMWSRFDDARFRSGAARLRNMITHPRGSAARRPGLEMVRKVKDSTREVRLLPFKFSNEQTHAIEMGRSVVDGRDIGYFRFHTNGGTLLHTLPDVFRPPFGVSSLDPSNEEWSIGSHDFQTGDPIVLTLLPDNVTETVTFDPANDTVDIVGHGFKNNEVVVFTTDDTLPPEVVAGRVYYVANQNANDFQIKTQRGGSSPIDFSSAGTGPHYVACLPDGNADPASAAPDPVLMEVHRTYYAIRRSSTTIAIAYSKIDALADRPINFVVGNIGTTDRGHVRIHHDYRNGSVVYYATGGVVAPFYCFKTPWGTPGSLQVNLEDHLGHAPSVSLDLNYWFRQPGSISTVTFDVGNSLVQWASHGLADGDPVTFSTDGTLPTGVIAGTAYYVRNAGSDDFQIATTVPGPVQTLSGTPAGTHTAFANCIYEVPHQYAEDVLFEVNHTQSNDVLTLVHADRPAAELRRLGPTHWVLADVEFNSAVAPPTGVEALPFQGLGMRVSGVTAATPAVLTTANPHHHNDGDPVMVTDVGSIADGTYIVDSSATTTLQLLEFESGNAVGSSVTTLGPRPRIRATTFAPNWNERYVVTTLDANDEESPKSSSVIANNNLIVAGAYNTISWEPVPGAMRYRIYKDLDGLYGYIGEVDAPATAFADAHILPDLSITPPILDPSLRKQSTVTFDLSNEEVVWEDHGLIAGTPVVIDTDGTAPTGLELDRTYYVLNPTDRTFQLGATLTATAAVALSGSPAGIHTATAGAFPSAVCYFEQRRVFGGAHQQPQDVWLTASGTESDLSYSIPTQDSDRISNRIASRERSQIRHAVPAGNLLLLTSAAEYRLTPINDVAILTPGSVSARAPSHVGTSEVAPVIVNNTVLFAAARGGHLREMGFLDQVGDYVTGDVSLRAAHLFDDLALVQLAYHKAPHPIVWAVSSSGTLLGFTYVPEEQIAGWHEHDTGGTIESCTVVAEGSEDRLYVVTQRGSTRYVERMGCQCIDAIEDVFFVDSGVAYSGTPVSSVFIPHLAGQSVVYLADGIEGAGTVSLSGDLALPVAASKVRVGLPYDSELRTLPLGMQVDTAAGSGRTKNVNQVWVRVSESGAFEAGPLLTALSDSPAPGAGELMTELVLVVIDGDWNLEGQVYVRQNAPLPLNVVAITLEVASGA